MGKKTGGKNKLEIQEFIERKEIERYIFWGVVTTIIYYLSYLLLKIFLPYQTANLINVVFIKILSYFTNKKFVFRTITNMKEQLKEIMRYVVVRGTTGVIDYFGLIVLVEILTMDDRLGKIIMIVIVTILNYILGKLFVFKKKIQKE